MVGPFNADERGRDGQTSDACASWQKSGNRQYPSPPDDSFDTGRSRPRRTILADIADGGAARTAGRDRGSGIGIRDSGFGTRTRGRPARRSSKIQTHERRRGSGFGVRRPHARCHTAIPAAAIANTARMRDNAEAGARHGSVSGERAYVAQLAEMAR